MKTLLDEIEKRHGLQDISVRRLSADHILLERHRDRATISIIAKIALGKYSVQVEVPNKDVPWVGLEIPFVSDDMGLENVCELAGKFINDN